MSGAGRVSHRAGAPLLEAFNRGPDQGPPHKAIHKDRARQARRDAKT